MDRTERLLSLIASLLDAREPVPAATIRSWFPEDYGAVSDEAFERKFERDKAVLVDLGVPLRFVHGDDGCDDGYVVDEGELYLPEIDFDAEALATLYMAGNGLLTQSEFPYHRDLARALDKIALRLEPDRVGRARAASRRVLVNHPVQQQTPGLETRLERVSEAIAGRQPLRLVYHTLSSGEVTERRVDPYGLRCWHGRWALIGYCHQRQDVRMFSLHRIRELEVVASASFELRDGFSIESWRLQPPWRYRNHEPVTVVLEVEAERAWLIEDQLGVSGVIRGDRVVVELEVTNGDGLIEWVLRQGPNVQVASPPALRDRVTAKLREVVVLYEVER